MSTVILATAHGFGEGVEKLGVIAVALLVAVVVLGRPPRISERSRALAALAVLVVTPALLLADIWHTSQLTHLRNQPAKAAAAVVLGLVVVAVLALVIHRRPRAFPLLAIFALPFRLPIATGGSTSNLLIPLYLVVGAGALAYALPRLSGAAATPAPADPAQNGAPEPAPTGWWARMISPRGLEWLLLAAVVLYALQAAYSADFSKALENMVFFYVPFALLFALLREVEWTRELLLQCLAVAVGARGRVRGDRLRRVRPQAAVPEPEGGGGRPVRQLLPGELALLRPEHLRPFPRAGDDRGDDSGAVEHAPPAGAARWRGAAVAAGGPRDELLAVEHRRAAARPRGAGRLPVGRARHDLRDGRAGGDRAGPWSRSRRRACTSG